MKYYFITLLILSLPMLMNAQQNYSDSLKLALKEATTDSAKFSIAYDLFTHYQNDNVDSALSYIGQALVIARKNNRKINEADCLQNIGMLLPELGKYAESLKLFRRHLKLRKIRLMKVWSGKMIINTPSIKPALLRWDGPILILEPVAVIQII
jgi:tetratricopeptide (TPR) repeat protein